MLACLAALGAEISRRPELESHAPGAVPLRKACPVGALLLIDVGAVYKDCIAALEGRVDRVYDALSRLKYVLAAAHDSRDGRKMLLEKRRLPSAG